MSDILSIASIICFILAGVFLVAAIALFFALDVRGVYAEINGKAPVKKKRSGKKAKVVKETPTEVSREVPTIIEDEAVTVLDSGEIDLDSLVNFYEPGTDLADETVTELDEENPALSDDEQPTAIEILIEDEKPTTTEYFFDDEQPTSAEDAITDFDSVVEKFEIQHDIMLTDRSKALYQLINQ